MNINLDHKEMDDIVESLRKNKKDSLAIRLEKIFHLHKNRNTPSEVRSKKVSFYDYKTKWGDEKKK